MFQFVGRALAAFLTRPDPNHQPVATSGQDVLLPALRRGDVLLVEGCSRPTNRSRNNSASASTASLPMAVTLAMKHLAATLAFAIAACNARLNRYHVWRASGPCWLAGCGRGESGRRTCHAGCSQLATRTGTVWVRPVVGALSTDHGFLFSQGEHLKAVCGNRNGMLPLSGQLLVTGHHGPAVVLLFDFGFSLIDHRFDREGHAFL